MIQIKRNGGSLDKLKQFVLTQKNLDCSKMNWTLYEKEFTKDKCPMSYGCICRDHSKAEGEYKTYCSSCSWYNPTENKHECRKHGITRWGVKNLTAYNNLNRHIDWLTKIIRRQIYYLKI